MIHQSTTYNVRIWGLDADADVRPMRTTISSIRRKLGDVAENPAYIFTELRVGYRMPQGATEGQVNGKETSNTQARMPSPDSTSSPSHSKPRSRALRLLAAVTGDPPASRWSSKPKDADELRYPATLFVWVRWFIVAVCLILLIYRPEFTLFTYVAYLLFLALLVALNGYVHYRVRSGRTVTLHWMLVLSAMDVVMITGGMAVAGGFSHFFFYLLYYPALAWFAVFFSSFRLTFAWVTMVAVIYAVVSLTVGEGLDFEAKNDKALFARIAVMYAVVASVNLLSSSEKMKRQEAVERERGLQRERIELSRTIHDTVAQSVYVVGLGVETARDLARETSDELAERLDAIHALSRTALWELRHPIDSGQIFEGRDLSEALSTHASSFTAITALPVEVVETGDEPDLSPLARGLLFAIVHNAMTNVLLHAQANRVEVALDFQNDHLCLSVSDDGIGIPHDRERRGHGLRNMAANAKRMGGSLEVSAGIGGAGTKATCVVPYYANPGGMWSVSDGTDQSDAG